MGVGVGVFFFLQEYSFYLVKHVHEVWRKKGEIMRVPTWEEGEQRGELGEVYCLYHLASNRVYVGMSYYGW